MSILTVGLAGLGLPACAGSSLNSPTEPTAVTSGPVAQTSDAGFCVDEINRLRATVGIAPLAHSDSIQAFANSASRIDEQAHEAHKYFRATNGGQGVVRAENEIPWWSFSQWGSVRTVIREGLALQWAEGPGGGHYDNMAGGFTEVACGIAVQDDEVTVTHDFR